MSRFILLSVVSVLGASTASARSLITTRAGCNQEFRGNKSVIAACTQCVSSGRYKKSAARGTWSCAASSSSSGEAIVYTPSTRAERPATQAQPNAMSSHNTYVRIPAAGTHTIGGDDVWNGLPESKVTLSRDFMMRVTEVTADDWMFLMGKQATSWTQQCGGECAAGGMAWNRIYKFLNRLSEMEGLEECYELDDDDKVRWPRGLDCEGYRLPTEAEWEVAARGDTKYRPYYGPLEEIAWTRDTGNGDPHPVGQKKPNSFGLYDMFGGNSEWVWDVYTTLPFPKNATDPIRGEGVEQSSLQYRVIRGGSYRDPDHYFHFAYRHYNLTDSGSNHQGFRPVRSLDPPVAADVPDTVPTSQPPSDDAPQQPEQTQPPAPVPPAAEPEKKKKKKFGKLLGDLKDMVE